MFEKEITKASTLIELLYLKAALHPERPAYTFLSESQDANISMSYGELVAQVDRIAHILRDKNLQGQRALILFPSNLDFLIAFLSCMAAEVVAVPAYPPRKNQNMARISSIVKDCRPQIVLTSSKIMEIAQPVFEGLKELRKLDFLCTDTNISISNIKEDALNCPSIKPETLAFLQYTSGSTGEPKGVMLTHGNLFHNQKVIQAADGNCQEGNIVSWLPLFHDMGLGIALQAIILGGHCSLMTPAAFIQNPQRWLWAIANDKAFLSGGPNFAYEHCVKMMKPELYEGLDLSDWKIAFSGAEPVKSKTIEKFSNAFKPYGFSSKAFMPCYGLAEATVAVSTSKINTGPNIICLNRNKLSENKIEICEEKEVEGVDSYVGCGHTWFDDELIIVDPDTKEKLGNDKVGEIWLRSKSIGNGYWEKEKITEEIFNGKTKDGEKGFLRTGDLGFLQNGELYITGRKKDLIILRGRNIYPQDVETLASESHEAINKNFSAAFTIDKKEETRLVLVLELEREFVRKVSTSDEIKQQIFQGIREAISREFEVQLDSIVLLKPGRIPKTSSGKVQRQACKKLFESNQIEVVSIWTQESPEQEEKGNREIAAGENNNKTPSKNNLDISELSTDYFSSYKEIKQWIEAWVIRKKNLRAHALDVNADFTTFGIDSIEMMELAGETNEQLNIEITSDVLWDNYSIHLLSEYLAKNKTANIKKSDGLDKTLFIEEEANKKHPLSFSQERLWFLEQMNEGGHVYDNEGVYKIKGHLNEKALQKAFKHLVNRHEVFRVKFIDQAGEVGQVLSEPSWDFNRDYLEVDDFKKTIEEYLEQWLGVGREKQFNLLEGPLLKVRLLNCGPENNVLQVRIHHIISDGWSLSRFVKELALSYDAFVNNSEPELPPLKVRYIDYLEWQNKYLQEELYEEGLKYWHEQLENTKSIDLPTDFSRPPVQTFNGRHQNFKLSRSITDELKKLAKKENTTLYNVLLTAFNILLNKYSAEPDICIGTPVANRVQPGSQDIIGMLVNTLPIRTRIEAEDSFLNVLSEVKRTTQNAYKYQSVPFSKILESLDVPRDISRSPLFQVMFVMQKASISSQFQSKSLALEELDYESGTSKFDLTFELVEEKGILKGSVEYNSDLFKQSTIERMIGHFQIILVNVLVDPGMSNSELQIMTRNEEEFLNRCNETFHDFGIKNCVHEAFEKQVEKTPDNVAVRVGGDFLSYEELNRKANQVCAWLIREKVKQNSRVGICIGRTINLMPAILGALKAGCTYVPLDPGYPSGRMKIMTEAADLEAVISEKNQFDKIIFSGQVLDLSSDSKDLDELSKDNIGLSCSLDSLLYLIFTSGSTGEPKCTAVTHRSAMNLYSWYSNEFSMSNQDNCLVISALGFDLTQKNLFTPLLSGAEVVLPDMEDYDVDYLIDIIGKNKIRWLNCAPSAFYPLQEKENQYRKLKSLKKVFLGGEPIQRERLKNWFINSRVELYNSYGPTECTDIAAYYKLTNKDFENEALIPIGKPNANVQLYVLDKKLNQLPVGVPGELYIGGQGVGPGYVNNEKLTEEKFIVNPFYESGKGHSIRLYKTGDKVRRLADGDLEFIGRFDHQIKLRGFRIEPGEIESALNAFKEVKESAVKVCSWKNGINQLVAYWAPVSNSELTNKEFKEGLRENLPEYMIPGVYIKLESLPLSINGKIDRDRLPEIEKQADEEIYIPATTETEKALAEIWGDVLDKEKVSINDCFFDIGGHSLLATKIVSRVRESFKIELTVKSLFSMTTIDEMARYIDTLLKARDDMLELGSGDKDDKGRQEIEL